VASPAPLLTLRGIGKRFPGVVALDNVDLTVRAGEIHALLGENGAGKSTLIKVLTGVHASDAGEIRLGGAPLRSTCPADAERAGISTVYQEVNLVPSLSVAENIALGRQPGRLGFLNWRAIRRHAREVLSRLEIDCDPEAELGTLSVALQQMVAIARALDLKARLLILDEPTASLDEKEVAELFAVMRRLRAEGMGIIFVTHFLDQVYAVCDRLTILRNGTLVGEFPVAGLPRLELVARMLGRDLAEISAQAAAAHAAHPDRAPLLAARGLARRGALHPLDLEVHRGEVVGLAGLLGSGRTETARLLFGIDARHGGEIAFKGAVARVNSPRDAIALGLAFCSEDRKTEGILPNLSVRENLIIALQAKRGGWVALARTEQEQLCRHYIEALKIKTADAEVPIRTLSGGNQQKVLLARWLATQPELIILDEPTRGIDIGAKAEIERLVAKLRAEGIAVIFISSEIEEVARNSTRAVVLRERRKCAELAGADIAPERLMQAMAGGQHE
jgi:simple sugar transport system ATP-binding protein